MAMTPRSSRWTRWLSRKPATIRRPFPALRMEELETREVPATFTWTGLGATNAWSDPNNWGGSAPRPAAQDDLVFPAGPTARAADNDFLASGFNSITFSTTVPNAGYTLTGNPITLGSPGVPGSGFILVNAASSGNTLQIDTALGALGGNNQFFTVNNGGDLTITGKLSGSTGSTLTKRGIGTLTLAADNSGFTGPIALENNAGVLQITNANALGAPGVATTVGTNSTLQVSNVAGPINELVRLNGPGVGNTGALRNVAGSNTWAGQVVFDSNVTLGADDGTTINITGVVSDSGAGRNLTKEGRGEVQLSAANSYRGLTTINSGILTIQDALALGASGTAANGTIVTSTVATQGQLRLASPGSGFTVLDEFLTLNGGGQSGLANAGSLTNTNADNTWAGPVTLGSPAPDGVDVTMGTGGGTLTISGVVSSPNLHSPGPPFFSAPYTLTKLDSGMLIFNNANTYNGSTFISAGTLDIRDSQGLGTNSVSVSNVGTLRLDVEAGIGAPNFDAHGRNLSIDSVTGDAHKLQVSNPLTLSGLGAGGGGALRSATGINIWTSPIFLTFAAAIGVDLDPRVGHPTPDASYFVNDYSLTTTNTIQDTPFFGNVGELRKVGLGQLILPVENTYTGLTRIQAGWVTAQNDRPFGAHTGVGQTVQPETIVSTGAAVHIRTLAPGSPPIHIDENLVLAGNGPTYLPYSFINGKGALMNLGGDNFWGVDSTANPIWFGYLSLNGVSGIGVETVEPGATSSLTIVANAKDFGATPGGIAKFGSQLLTLEGAGTYTGATDIREGPLSARHNTALGQATSGTAARSEAYSQTSTSVRAGAILRLDQSIGMLSGGIASGVQIANEQLLLNGPAQQIGVAGSLVPAPTTFTLTFNGYSTAPLIPGLSALELQAALFELPSIHGSEVQSVQVGASGNFTLAFNGQTTASLPFNAGFAAVQIALNNLTSIARPEIQTVRVTATAGTFTLTFNGQTTGPLPFNAPVGSVIAALNALSTIGGVGGSVAVTSTVFAGGTQYTVTFGGSLATANLVQMTGLGSGGASVVVTTQQDGLGGSVTVTEAPGVPTGTVYTVAFGGDLAFTNLPPLIAVGSAAPVVSTVRDGVNGTVAVTDAVALTPGGGNAYTVAFGGDLANVNLPLMTAAAPNGTVPTTTTLQDGGGALSEIQKVTVVAANGSYTLTYRSPVDGSTRTTGPLPITAPSIQVRDALNGLTNLAADVGSVVVSRTGNIYTVVFGNAHTRDVPLLIAAAVAAPATPEVTVSGATIVDGYASEASLVSLSQDNAWRGPVTLTAGSRIATAANSRISLLGPVDDATNLAPTGSDLVKRGQGETVLAGLNTFRGTTWIDEGIATAANSSAFGATTQGTTVAKNAQLQIQGSWTIAGEALTVQGSGVPSASTLSDQWFNVGPASTNNGLAPAARPTSGRITSIASDPTDANVIYIATAGGGAWKTKDRGLTWNPLFDDTVDAAAVLYGGAITVAPSNPNVVYFATGEPNGRPNGSPITGLQDNYSGSGVYVSFNAGATWTLVVGPASNNPLFGLTVTKMIVDPTNALRIYVATGATNAFNVPIAAIPGVYRYDGSAATPDWVNLTGSPSRNRATVLGTAAPYDVAPAGNAGPDDDYRIMFPQSNATWSDIALVRSGGNPFTGANPGNTIAGNTWVLYAALGESQQRYFGNAATQAILNGVYRTEDPANAFAAGRGPTWWIGSGSIYPVASTSGPAASTNAIAAVTTPDARGESNYYPVGPITPPNPFHLPGSKGWIKVQAVVTNYYNSAPASSFPGNNVNAYITVYGSNLANGTDNWSGSATGQLLDISRSGWDGGIATAWATVTGPAIQPFGLTTVAPTPGAPTFALGRYDNTLLIQDVNFGLLTPTANREVLYIGGKDDIFKTSNAFSSNTPAWTTITQAGGVAAPASFYHALVLDRTSGNLLSGTDGGIWNYDGTNFTDLNGNLAITQLNAADPNPTDINQAYAASYNNGLQQFAGSLAWKTTNPGGGRNSADIRYDSQNPLTAYAAVSGVLYKTIDGGANWTALFAATGANSFPIYADPVNTPRILFGGNGIVESTQGGAPGTFVNLLGGSAIAVAGAVYQGQFVLDPGFPLVTDKLSNTYDPDTIYLTDGATVRVTKNHGVTWISRPPFSDILYTVTFGGSLANTNVPQIGGGGAGVAIKTLQQGSASASETQTIEVTKSGGTYTLRFGGGPGSTTVPIPYNATALDVENALNALPGISNGGTGFVTVRSGPGATAITDVAVDASNRDTAYVTLRSNINNLAAAVFRTTDAGQNWVDLTGNLPLVQTWTVAVDPRTDTIYVGNDRGVWQLTNASKTQTFVWTRFGAGMPNVQVHDLVLNQTLNTLTAATYGRGMFQLLLTDYQASSGAIRAVSGSSLWTGPVTLAGDTLIVADGTQQIQNGIAAASLNILGPIDDSAPGNNSTLTKSGLGTIIFSGSNTYGGQTLIQQGVLQSSNARALGLPTANTIVAAGAALALSSDLQAEPVLLNGNGIAFNGHNTGALRNVANNNVYTGPLTFGTNTTIGVDSGTALTIGVDPKGAITGTGSMTDAGRNFTLDKELAGTLVLATANAYGGVTTVDQGAIRVEDAFALGSSGPFSGTVVRDGAQVQISRNAVTLLPTVVPTESLLLSGTGIDVTGALRNVRGDAGPGGNDNTWRGPIAFSIVPNFSPQTNPGSRIAIGVDASGIPGVVDALRIDTNIQQDASSASFGLIKVGAGRLALAQANSYTGTTEVGATIGGQDYPGGALRIENSNGMGPANASNSVQTLAVVGTTPALTYQLSFGGQTTGALSATATAAQVQAALNSLSTIGTSEVQTVALGGAGTFTLTFNGQTTAALASGDSAAAVATALNGLVSIGRSELQDVQISGTAGQFTLTFNGQTTGPLLFNDTDAAVQAALEGLGTIGVGNVAVTSTRVAGVTVYHVAFQNARANANQPQIAAAPYVVATAVDGTGAVSEQQIVSVTSTTGTFILTFSGLTTIPIPFDATAQQVEDALNDLPSVGGVGGSVAVARAANAPGIGGFRYTVTFGGTLANTNVQQMIAQGAGGPATAVATIQEGLGGSVGVTKLGSTFTITFGGTLANQDVPPLIASGAAAPTVATTTEGAGVTVSETPGVNGKLLTVTFQRSVPVAQVPQLQAVNVSTNLAVNVGTAQPGGAGAAVAAGAALELNGDPTGVGASIDVAKVLAVNGMGLVATGASTGVLNNVSGNNTYSGAVTLATSSHLGAVAGTTLTIPIVQDPTPLPAPAPKLTKVGTGTIAFPNANGYGGLTEVREGVLAIQNPQAIGAGRSEVQTFDALGTIGAFSLTFNGQTTIPALLFSTTGAAQVQAALNALSSVQRTEIQSLQVTGSSGSFTLALNYAGTTATTGSLAFNASAAAIQSALELLPNIGAGNVAVAGAAPNYTITFIGTLANKDLPRVTGAGVGGAAVVTAGIQDGLNGAATVTSVPVPNGNRFTVTFGGDLANINLPQLVATPGIVFTNTVTNGSASPAVSEVQNAQVFASGGSFALTFNGQTTGGLPVGSTDATVQTALLGLSTIRHNEQQDITVLGTSGTFTVTFNGQTTAAQAFNVAAGTLQAALEGLSTIGGGNVAVTSNAVTGGTVYHITFQGALGFTNLPQLTAAGLAGASPSVATILDGLGGSVVVARSGVAGSFSYTIAFGGSLANTDVPLITGAATAAPSFTAAGTLADGNGSETQSVQVTGSNGTFFLTFNGSSTGALLYTASAADVEAALNLLPSIGGIGGTTAVTLAGTPNGPGGAVYTVTFGGALADLNLPLMLKNSTGGTVVNITTGNDGPEGTTVDSGATLQLRGNMIMDREVVTIDGLGFQNQGALNVNGGNVTWQAFSSVLQIPLYLGGNAAIGTTAASDNLVFQLPITDSGTPRNLDVFGPGTVRFAGTGSALFNAVASTEYTGTTRVHDGTLLLDVTGRPGILGPLFVGDGVGLPSSAIVRELQNHEVADASPVTVNADGLFDLNGKTDTIAALTVNAGTVNTRANGHLTTADVRMAGGTIFIGDNGSVTSGNAILAAGAAITGGNTSTLAAGNITATGGSTIRFGNDGTVAAAIVSIADGSATFGIAGKLTTSGDLTLDNSTATFGDTGTIATKNVALTNRSRIAFANGGTLNAAGNLTATDSGIGFGNGGALDAVTVNLTNAAIAYGDGGVLTATGPIALNKSTISFGNGGSLNGGDITGILGSVIRFLLSGILNAGTAGKIALTDSSIALGDGAIGNLTRVAAGDVKLTNSSLAIGRFSLATVGNVTMTSSTISIGANSTATTRQIDIAGGSIAVGDNSTLTSGNVNNAGAAFAFGNSDAFNAGAVSASTGGSFAFGAAGRFTTSGDVALDNAAVTMGAGSSLDTQTRAATLSNGSNIALANGSSLTVGNLSETASTVSLGAGGSGSTGKIDLIASSFSIGALSTVTLNGDITANSTAPANQSAILGPGTLDVGGANRTLAVGNGDGADNVDLRFTALVGSTPAARLIKTGAGRLDFAPATGFPGPVALQVGDTQVDTSIGPVQMTGGSLSGNGFVGAIDGGSGGPAVGTINPGINWQGNRAGTLHSGAATWGSGTVFSVDLSSATPGSPTAGTDYDQLQVTGDIRLNGATLTGAIGSGILFGDRFTIVQTTGGTVQGAFARPPGHTDDVVFIQGQKFAIDYSDPTRVVLRKIRADIVSPVAGIGVVDVASSANPATLRQPILLTATMAPEAGAGAIPPTSTATFTLRETTSGTTIVVARNVGAGNVATLDTSTLPGGFLADGTYTVAVLFNGDPLNFNTATGALTGTQVVETPVLDPLSGLPPYISPNQSPGVQDSLALTAIVQKERGSINWSIAIVDGGGTTVRTLTGTGGTGGPHLNVPISTAWDGKVSAALGGGFAPEGTYTLTATFTDQFTNTGTTAPISVVVDNTNPTAATLTNTNVLIAPGVASVTVPGTTELTSTVGDLNLDHWSIVVSSGGIAVRTFTGTTTSVDAIWDGKNDGGAIVGDAAYALTLTAYDKAGNFLSPAAQTVVVLTHPPTITLSSNGPTVYGQTIALTATVSLPTGTPNSVTSLLASNPVEFYNGAALLGSGTLSLIGTQYQSILSIPTFNAGSYPNLFVKYLGTTNFLPGNSPTIAHVVNKAPLSATANTIDKVYGAPLPPLTLAAVLASGALAVTGLVNGDTGTGVLSGALGTTATQSSPVVLGGYPIAQNTLAANSNYQLTFVVGTLNVTKAPLAIAIDDARRPIFAANPTFTFSAQGLVLGDPASVVTGLSLTTAANVNSPVGMYPITASGTPTAQNYSIASVVNGTLSVTPIPTEIIVGAGATGAPLIRTYSTTGQAKSTSFAFDPAFAGGVRVAAADFNRDGVLDYAVGTGPGVVALVRVIDGATGGTLFSVNPFDNFTGGVFVAAGDINADGAAELVITPDEGGGPRVVVYRGGDFAPMLSYFGINDPAFRGGARAAVGDLNNDGYADIAVSAGFNGGPRVSLWDGQSLSSFRFKNLTPDFFVFEESLRNGAYVAIGDVNGDGFGDLIAGAGPGGGPRVKVFDGRKLLTAGPGATQPFASFFAGDPNNRGGVRVTAKTLDGDLFADIVAGVGDGGGDKVTAIRGSAVATGNPAELFTLDPFPGFANGVFVG